MLDHLFVPKKKKNIYQYISLLSQLSRLHRSSNFVRIIKKISSSYVVTNRVVAGVAGNTRFIYTSSDSHSV